MVRARRRSRAHQRGHRSARPATIRTTADPIVAIELTAAGRRRSRRSPASSRSAAPQARRATRQTSQHFAIVLDDRIVSVPFIDYREAPDGIDGAAAHRSRASDAEQARRTAALLSAGPLPGTLQLVPG